MYLGFSTLLRSEQETISYASADYKKNHFSLLTDFIAGIALGIGTGPLYVSFAHFPFCSFLDCLFVVFAYLKSAAAATAEEKFLFHAVVALVVPQIHFICYLFCLLFAVQHKSRCVDNFQIFHTELHSCTRWQNAKHFHFSHSKRSTFSCNVSSWPDIIFVLHFSDCAVRGTAHSSRFRCLRVVCLRI